MSQINSRIRIDDKTKKFIAQHTSVMDKALTAIGNDVLDYSQLTVPYKSGDLAESGELVDEGVLDKAVYYGRTKPTQDYASVQEDGGKDWQYTTPGTGAHYLEDAVKKVMPLAFSYFKRAAGKL